VGFGSAGFGSAALAALDTGREGVLLLDEAAVFAASPVFASKFSSLFISVSKFSSSRYVPLPGLDVISFGTGCSRLGDRSFPFEGPVPFSHPGLVPFPISGLH
jgi:hypothetical protein